MKYPFKTIALAIMISAGLVAAAPLAHAQLDTSTLFISPERLTFPSTARTQLIAITNKSHATARYDVQAVDYVMLENGTTKRVDSFKYSVKPFLRYTPKRFSLEPNERTVIRIMVNPPDDLPEGDYHSHILFREIPELKKKGSDSSTGSKNRVKFEINTIYGIGIPIVMQHGALSSQLSMEQAKLERTEKGPLLSATFKRTGNAEALGRLNVSHVKPGQEPVRLIPEQLIRMYHEVDTIERRIKLDNLKQYDLTGGELILTLNTMPKTNKVVQGKKGQAKHKNSGTKVQTIKLLLE